MQWNPDQSEEWARFCKKEFNMTDFNPASLHIPGMDLCSMTPGFLTTTIVGPKYVAETLYLCLEKLKGTTSSKCSPRNMIPSIPPEILPHWVLLKLYS